MIAIVSNVDLEHSCVFDESEFKCKGLHLKIKVSETKTKGDAHVYPRGG